MSAPRIDGAAVAAALRGRRETDRWRFCCPCHDDRKPSAVVRDDGLVTCFAGCDRGDVLAELRRLGLYSGGAGRRQRFRPRTPTPEELAKAKRDRDAAVRKAQAIWSRSTFTRAGAEVYLRSRRITIPAPSCIVGHGDGILIGMQNLAGELIAVQIKQRGRKGISHGRMEDGAVQLAVCDDELGLAEGVETALSATQITGVPCWAVLGARMASVRLPPNVKRLYLFGDNDPPGREQLEKAREAYRRKCEVIVRYPPEPHKDWNDYLQDGGCHG